MRTRFLALSLLGATLLLAACGGGAATPAPATTAPATAAPATAAPATEAPASEAPAAAGTTVALGTTSLGEVLVDGKGMTLYMFTADADGKSACSGDCLASWPVLAGEGVTPGAGLDAADFGTITRDDGSSQVTFFDMPLYTFVGDKAPGDVTGQGVGGKWYVLLADGTVVK